jgi:hypothetical protein
VVLFPTATLPATAITKGTFAVESPRNALCAAHSRRLAATCRLSRRACWTNNPSSGPPSMAPLRFDDSTVSPRDVTIFSSRTRNRTCGYDSCLSAPPSRD